MPRYVGQRDKYSCGPVVIMNAIKWAGGHATMKKDHKRLTKAVYCGFVGDQHGTHPLDLDPILRREGFGRFEVVRFFYPSIQEFEEHVRKDDCAAVISFNYINRSGKFCGHYTLVIDVSFSGKTFTYVNESRGKLLVARLKRQTVVRFRRSTVIDDLKPSLTNSPCAWFLAQLNK